MKNTPTLSQLSGDDIFLMLDDDEKSEQIVHAVNMHDELVEALIAATETLAEFKSDDVDYYRALILKARSN